MTSRQRKAGETADWVAAAKRWPIHDASDPSVRPSSANVRGRRGVAFARHTGTGRLIPSGWLDPRKALFSNFIDDIVRPNDGAAWFGIGGKNNDCGLDLGGLQSIDRRKRLPALSPISAGRAPCRSSSSSCGRAPFCPTFRCAPSSTKREPTPKSRATSSTRGDFLQPYVYGDSLARKTIAAVLADRRLRDTHRRGERMVGPAPDHAFGAAHRADGASGDAPLRKPERLAVCGAVIHLLPAVAAETDHRRARHADHGVVVCRVAVVVERRCVGPPDDPALDRLRSSARRARHGERSAAGGVLRSRRSPPICSSNGAGETCRAGSCA